MDGFFNKLVRIDLTRHSASEEALPDDLLERCLGGKGLGTHLMLQEIPERSDALSEDNKLILATGPAAGTRIWGSARYGVFTKSPLTGIYGESYAGGKVAPVFKKTGCDAIILEGRSPEPVWLEVTDRGITFHEASGLWGKDTYETEDAVTARAGKGAQSIVIGPAGENLVRFALIENNRWRSAGRCGMGAVLGSKNVKAVTFNGSAACSSIKSAINEGQCVDLLRHYLRPVKCPS